MPAFPSDEWLQRYRDAINSSESYREKAAGWEGDITYVIGADAAAGFDEDVLAWVDLWHGSCRDARLVDRDDGERAAYVISAPYSLWKSVLLGQLDPVKAMVQGKLKLRGDLPRMAEHVEATRELVSLAVGIATTFADE